MTNLDCSPIDASTIQAQRYRPERPIEATIRLERLKRMLSEYEAADPDTCLAWMSTLGQEDVKRAIRLVEAGS